MRVIFSGTASVISEIAERYGLEETWEKILEKMIRMSSSQIKKEISGETPGRRIAIMVKEVSLGEISLEEFPYELQKRLNISLEKAKKMAPELLEKILIIPADAEGDIIISENAASVIDEIAESYRLEETREEMLEKMNQMSRSPQKEEIFDESPRRRIASTVKEVSLGEISLAEFPYVLKKRLNISLEKAKKM
ncbi:hypothetical protein C5S53_11975, partial [Methanophagales archaeon]